MLAFIVPSKKSFSVLCKPSVSDMQIQPCKPDPAQFLELSITSTVLVVGLASKASAVHAHDHWL